LILLTISPAAFAQQVPIDPASTHIFPAGGQRGSVAPVRIGSQCLPPQSALKFWGEGVTAPAVLGPRAVARYESSPRRDPRETPMSYAREWESVVEISADAPLGQKLWRLSSGRGGVVARPFIVGELPEFVESESNSSPDKAERVSLGVTINGQIAGERDVDYFQFSVLQGETVTAEVVAARLGSPLETIIEFHDSGGRRQQAQEFRLGSDPVLVFKAPASGEYRLFVANLSFRGGPEFVYRITLNKLPYVQLVFPAVLQAGTSREIETFRAFGDGALQRQIETVTAPRAPGEFWLAAPTAANPLALEASEDPTLVEREPNDDLQQAMEIATDVVVSGQLAKPTDQDWFRFTAAKDQTFSIECKAAPKTAPTLPVVQVVDGGGAILASVKGVEAADRVARLDWRATFDGPCYLRVIDIAHGAAGGPEFVYALSLRRGRPDFSLLAKSDFVNVVQEGRSELELAVLRRGGFDRPIDLSITGLPEGVRYEPQQIAAGQTSLKVAFLAAADARPTAAALQIAGVATIDGVKRSHVLAATHLGHDAAGVGVGPSTIDNVQLTVAHKPVFKLYCSEAYQYAYRGTVYPYSMQIERLDGFAGPIHLEVADRQIKDLDGIEVREMTVEPGQSSFMLPLYLPETMHINIQAHSNVYAQGYVTFVDKWGQQQSDLVVSTMRCMVRTLPPIIRLRAVDRVLTAKPGETVPCHLDFLRTSNFSGPVKIELMSQKGSSGCAAEPVVLQDKETQTSIAVRLSPDVKPQTMREIRFRATGAMPNGGQAISEAGVLLQVD
jgi:hypothetical protein